MKIRQQLLRISKITSYDDLRNPTSAVQNFKIQQWYEMLKNGVGIRPITTVPITSLLVKSSFKMHPKTYMQVWGLQY